MWKVYESGDDSIFVNKRRERQENRFTDYVLNNADSPSGKYKSSQFGALPA